MSPKSCDAWHILLAGTFLEALDFCIASIFPCRLPYLHEPAEGAISDNVISLRALESASKKVIEELAKWSTCIATELYDLLHAATVA